jgi:hypothetical protein
VRLSPKRDGNRRSFARLTPRPRYYLEAWGYPYVIDEFRLHFTLTNTVPNPGRLAKEMETAIRLPGVFPGDAVDAVTLFGDATHGCEFRILRRFTLGRPGRACRHGSRPRLSSTDNLGSQTLLCCEAAF